MASRIVLLPQKWNREQGGAVQRKKKVCMSQAKRSEVTDLAKSPYLHRDGPAVVQEPQLNVLHHT